MDEEQTRKFNIEECVNVLKNNLDNIKNSKGELSEARIAYVLSAQKPVGYELTESQLKTVKELIKRPFLMHQIG